MPDRDLGASVSAFLLGVRKRLPFFVAAARPRRIAMPCRIENFDALQRATVEREELLARACVDGALHQARPAETISVARAWHAELSHETPLAPLPADLRKGGAYTADPVRFLRLDDLDVNAMWGVAVTRTGGIVEESRRAADYRLGGVETLPGFARHGETLTYRSARAKHAPLVEGPCLHSGHRYCDVYGHWFSDLMTAVWIWREEIISGRLKLLVPAHTPAWGLAVLAKLGVMPAHCVVPRKRRIRLRRAIVGSSMGMGGIVRPPAVLRELGSDLVRRIVPSGSAVERRLLYVTREGDVNHSIRQLANEGELLARLLPLGFEVLRPGRLPFDEQVRLFASARLIVAPHGSALMNLIFAPAGCGVVDLLPWTWASKATAPWAQRLAGILDHRYAVVMGEPCAAAEDGDTGRIIERCAVDVDAVLRAVQAFLA